MIVVATSHPAIRDEVARAADSQMIWVDDWQKVGPLSTEVSQLFLAQDVEHFEMALAWLDHRMGTGWTAPVVVWVRDDYHHPTLSRLEGKIEIWRGEIDQEKFQQWRRKASPLPQTLALERHWGVISLFPHPSLRLLVATLTDQANRTFGAPGGWIDVEWFRADCSLVLAPELYERRRGLEWALTPYRTNQGYLVPAPPGWHPGQSFPNAAQLAAWTHLPWAWQGWFFGAQYASSLAIAAFDHVSQMVLWTDESTPQFLVAAVQAFVETYRPDMAWVTLSPSLLARSTAATEPEPRHALAPSRRHRTLFNFGRLSRSRSPHSKERRDR
ncbi:MAG: hypothetical protein OWU84_07025 [Firmicutes bacterium]|nr:hypothetical protein [Bacillota bacterium]